MKLNQELQDLLDRSQKVLTLQDTEFKAQVLKIIRDSETISSAEREIRGLGITSQKVLSSAKSLARLYHKMPSLAFEELISEYDQ